MVNLQDSLNRIHTPRPLRTKPLFATTHVKTNRSDLLGIVYTVLYNWRHLALLCCLERLLAPQKPLIECRRAMLQAQHCRFKNAPN